MNPSAHGHGTNACRHGSNGWRPQLLNSRCDSDKKEWLMNMIGGVMMDIIIHCDSDGSVEHVDDVVVDDDCDDDVFVVVLDDDDDDDDDDDAFVVDDGYTHKDRITIAPTNTPYYSI